jgi:hypothetical protein
VLGARTVVDSRVNYSGNTSADSRLAGDYGGASSLPLSSLLPAGVPADQAYVAFFAGVGIAGGYVAEGPLGGTYQRQLNVTSTLSHTLASHQLKVGVDYRRLFPQARPAQYLFTYLGGGPLALVNGTLPNLTHQTTAPGEPIFENFSLYGQDTWRASSRLTLTYGLRWEVNPAPFSGNGAQPVLVTGLTDPTTIQFLPEGRKLWTTGMGNIAPRIGGAYTLSTESGRELVVRGGWGMFYDTGQGTAGLAFGGGFPSSVSATNAAHLPPTDAEIALPTPDRSRPLGSKVFAFPSDLALPVTYQWDVSIERAFGTSQAISVTYVGAAGRDLLRRELYDFSKINPIVQNVESLTNAGYSNYRALQIQYERRLSSGISALVSYSFGRAKDTDSTGATQLPPASRVSIGSDYGYSDYDVRQNLRGAATVDLGTALLRSTGSNSVAARVLNGLSFDALVTYQSAPPITPIYSRNLGFGSFSFRPDLVPGVPIYIDDPASPGGKRVNFAAFVQPVDARQGTAERNSIRGFDLMQVDAALSKRIPLPRHLGLSVRLEAFNIFNHPNFGLPYASLASQTQFGRAQTTYGASLGAGGPATGLNPLFQVGGPRSTQLSARVTF